MLKIRPPPGPPHYPFADGGADAPAALVVLDKQPQFAEFVHDFLRPGVRKPRLPGRRAQADLVEQPAQVEHGTLFVDHAHDGHDVLLGGI